MQKLVQRCLVRIFWNERSRSTLLDRKLMFWCVSFLLGAFGTVSLLHKTCCKTRQTVQLMQKFVPWCLVRIYATNAPDPHHSSLRSSFGVFLSVRVHFGPFRYCTKHGAKRAKLVQLMQKFVQRCLVRIFRNERSRSNHWTLNSCCGSFLSVWVHLELFRYCTKLAAKHAKLVQLMQSFVPRSRVGILRNVSSRSTALDPKLMFWWVSFRLGAFGTVSLLHENAPNWRN